MIDFSKLGIKVDHSSFEPRDIFMSLPTKGRQYEYPRDIQSEVWKNWFENRNQKKHNYKDEYWKWGNRCRIYYP